MIVEVITQSAQTVGVSLTPIQTVEAITGQPISVGITIPYQSTEAFLKGDKGDKGDVGESSYQYAVRVLGFTGTEVEYADTNQMNIILLAFKPGYDSYMEYTEVNGNITQVNYWADSSKVVKLFTKGITYSGSNPSVVTMKDELANRTLTTTFVWSGSTITNITKVLS